MGKRGPATQPTNLKLLRGNPGRRPLPENEPKPELLKELVWPEWLTIFAESGKTVAIEAIKWGNKVAPELIRLGLLTVTDEAAFLQMCLAYGEWVDNVQFCIRHGSVLPIYSTDKNGNFLYDDNGKKIIKWMQQIPQACIAPARATLYLQIGARFGMTPSDRTRIQIPKKELDTDGIEDFLFNPGEN